mmetsp:Transcript_37179/g.104908  ORF Transcript_37179/g.104908 Transcript_37179/m.104908 type:complete len:394 (+) Transcript_37179:65-1246(+)
MSGTHTDVLVRVQPPAHDGLAAKPEGSMPSLPSQCHIASQSADETPQPFFESYLRSLVGMVIGHDCQESHAAWTAHLHPAFIAVSPSGAVGDRQQESVLGEWRMSLAGGCYTAPSVSKWFVQEHSATCVDCIAVLQKTYATRNGSLSRDIVHLRATASHCMEDGCMRVMSHFYMPAPPALFHGIASRSQIGQDLWVLDHFPGVSKGFFLEVGANHCEELSNTFLLERAAGWTGICIEPFPQGDWSTRSAKLVRGAIGPDAGKLKFIAPGHVLGGFVDSVNLPRVQQQVPKVLQQVVEVETRTLLSVLSSPQFNGGEFPKVIHYLSLDTEGSEYSILCQFPFSSCKLLSVTVEHNFIEPTRTKIRELLQSHGFVVDVSVEHDDFYILEDYRKYI